MFRAVLAMFILELVMSTESGISESAVRPTSSATSTGNWSTLNVDGREADVFVPTCARAGSPLILSLHAWGTTKKLQESTNDMFSHAEYIGPECAVVVYPEGKLRPSGVPLGGFSWNAGGCCPRDNSEHVNDVGFLGKLITKVMSAFDVVNKDLVFVVGVSNGGMMANRLACTDVRIKALVSIAGPLINGTTGHDLETFACTRRVPVLHFHGDADPIVPYGGCNATSGGSICENMKKIFGDSVADRFPSVPDYIEGWRTRNGHQIKQPSTITFQNGTTNCTSWGDAGSNVTLCIVGGQGHAWPGHCSVLNKIVPGCGCSQAIDASYHALAFLRRYMHSTSILI